MNKETLKKNLREMPDFPKPGILFYDVTTLFKNPRNACRAFGRPCMNCTRKRNYQSGRYRVQRIHYGWCPGGPLRSRIHPWLASPESCRQKSSKKLRPKSMVPTPYKFTRMPSQRRRGITTRRLAGYRRNDGGGLPTGEAAETEKGIR